MQKKRINRPLTLITALLVVMIAALTGSTLAVLRQMHRKSAHEAAAQVVVQQGQTMVSRLSSQPSVTLAEASDTDWREFSRLVQNLYTIEDGLQYVSVVRDDVVLFHEQTQLLDGTPPTEPAPSRPAASGNIAMHREVLHVGDEIIPVVVFSTTIRGATEGDTRVNVALRKDTVNREEQAASASITSMFRLTLLTIVVSFSICVILVVWMMRREAKRESSRRKEEHLAFSGMLANGIVHDFRNPMSSMRLDVQMLNRESEKGDAARPDRIQQLATRTRKTLDRMDKVFEEFLYVSRPDKGAPTTVDLAACIRDSLDMLTPRFEKAEVSLHVDMPKSEVPVFVYEASLRRAIVNVLTNAEQFSPVGETVDIRIQTGNDTVALEVQDRGPGIPKRDRKAVFEIFVTTRPEGTGLGLFIAKAAIERSGGTISIADGPATRGACIRIELPLVRQKGAHHPSDGARTDATSASGTETAY
jgi:K+-sensing histidine kinase KdpD